MTTRLHRPLPDGARNDATRQFEAATYPQEKDEAWRYTDISDIAIDTLERRNTPFLLTSQGPCLTMDMRTATTTQRRLIEQYGSLTSGEPKDKIELLNDAFWANGFFTHAAAGTSMVTVSGSSGVFRNIVIAEPGARLTVIESLSGGVGLNNSLTNVICMPDSQVTYVLLQRFTESVTDFSTKRAFVNRNASMSWNFCIAGSRLTRTTMENVLDGEGAHGEATGVFLGKNDRHVDVTCHARHRVPNTTNRITSKGVMRDRASSIFRGVIRIDKNAQKTNSYLSDNTLKLSPHTVANSVPSLFIDANDVKASHAATVGQIDDDQLFYIMSRGLAPEQAERVIVEGFFAPVLAKAPTHDFREQILQAIEDF